MLKKTISPCTAFAATSPVFAAETCDLVTHQKMSLVDFAESSADTEHFFFSDNSALTRDGNLTILGDHFEIEDEEFRDVYECTGGRNGPCIRKDGDDAFIGEARIDRSMNVVAQLERHVSGGSNMFSRGGVADGGLRLWKILSW
ncbi:hypothetical protein [Falsihalocynthiibacter sp. CO-5D18]|uniref:hypothetical protein n=1 Tax=Falsihalocynthiibacter sp. CO-5D18 TaxID=3240872 RepID=UPI00350F1770